MRIPGLLSFSNAYSLADAGFYPDSTVAVIAPYNFERIAVQRSESPCAMSISSNLHRSQEVFVLLFPNIAGEPSAAAGHSVEIYCLMPSKFLSFSAPMTFPT
jgi:hypothetical protein